MDELVRLHPASDPPTLPSSVEHPELISESQLIAAVRAARESAPGPSGIRAEHILLTWTEGRGHWMQMAHSIQRGQAPEWLRDARLVAFNKERGGVRPIAMGELIRRTTVSAAIRAAPCERMPPLGPQLSFTANGTSITGATVDAARRAGLAVAEIDISNAFNSVSRTSVLQSTANSALGAYTHWAYALPSKLLVAGEDDLLSRSGVQQGDPAGPLLFAAALEAATASWRARHNPRGVRVLWYADDGFIYGPPTALEKAIPELFQALHLCALTPNLQKCRWWGPLPPSGAAPIPTAGANEALTPVGVPVEGHVDGAIRERVQSAIRACAPLERLQHKQSELLVLRQCGPTARLRHLAHFVGLARLHEADEATLGHLSRILGCQAGVERASLPLEAGGLGVPLLSQVCCSTDINASTIAAAAWLHTPADLVQHLRPCESPAPAPRNPTLHTPEPDTKLAAAFMCPHANDFLLALPSGDNRLEDDEFDAAIRFRILNEAPPGHTNCCQVAAAGCRLGCSKAAGQRTRRHNGIARVISRLAQQAGMLIATEARDGLAGQDRSDVLLRMTGDRDPRPVHLDVTVSSPWNVTLPRSATHPEAAAEAARARKEKDYQHTDVGYKVVPLAVTAAGVWEAGALRWLKGDFANQLAYRLGGTQSEHAAALMASLSTALWRGNAWMLRWRAQPDADTGDEARDAVEAARLSHRAGRHARAASH
jgi:hypothetical protein